MTTDRRVVQMSGKSLGLRLCRLPGCPGADGLAEPRQLLAGSLATSRPGEAQSRSFATCLAVFVMVIRITTKTAPPLPTTPVVT